ncbi:hypothetical protein D3C71_1598100 [compost metagenome]
MQRRVARLTQVVDARAERAEGVDQVADGALVHARHARQAIVAAHQGQRGRQRSDRGAGIAHEQVRAFHREATYALHRDAARVQLGHLHAKLAQGAQHDARIVGVQQAGDDRAALGDCRQ